MAGVEEEQKSKRGPVAASFISSLYAMTMAPEFQDLVSFSSDGNSFVIKNVDQFSKQVLPLHYKHCHFSSFSRQLCFYSFKKLSKAKTPTSSLVEYCHPYFVRGRPDLLPLVVRKTNASGQAQLEAEEAKLREKEDQCLGAQAADASRVLPPVKVIPKVVRPEETDSETSDASGRAIGALASLGMMPGRTIQSFLESDGDSPMDEKKGGITMSVARRSSRRLESKTVPKPMYDSKRSSDEDYAQNFGDDDESEEAEGFQAKTSHTFAVGKTNGGAGPQRPPIGLYTGTAASSDMSDNEESLRVGIKPKIGGRSKAPVTRKAPAPHSTYGSSMSFSMVEAMYANRTADLQAIDRDTDEVDSEFVAINSQLVKLMQGHASTRRDLVVVLQSLREVAKKWPNELRRVNVDPNQLGAALALVAADSGPDFDAKIPLGGKHTGPNALIQALHDVKLSNRAMPTPTAAGSWQQDYLMLYPPASYMADVAAHGIYVQPAALPIDTPHAGDHAAAGRKRGYSEVATQSSSSTFPEGDSGSFTPGSTAPALDTRPGTGDSKRARLDDPRVMPAPALSSTTSGNDAFSRPPGLNTDLMQPEPMGSMGLTPALAMHSTNDQEFSVPLSKPLLPDLLPVSEAAAWRPSGGYMVATPLTHGFPQYMSGYGPPLTMQHMNMLMDGGRTPEGRNSGAGAFPTQSRPSYMYLPQYAHTPSAGMGMQSNSQFMGSLGVPVAPIYTTMPAKISMSMTSPLSPNTTTHAASNGMSSDSHILTNTSSSAAGLTVASSSTPSNGMQMQTI